jgi:hypothetical protein
MTYDEVEHIEYSEEIWASEQRPSAKLTQLLTAKDRLIVLRNGEPPFQVVLGVPHQAASGVESICEEATSEYKNRVSDEGAASYALVAFTELRNQGVSCKLVVMAHPTTHNPNKKPGSPYWQEIFVDNTELLFECHGAADDRRDLELSAGSNHLVDPVAFGQALAASLDDEFVIGVQKEAGDEAALILGSTSEEELQNPEIDNPALETDSLIEAEKQGVEALHLEATPEFRKPTDGSNTVTSKGLILGRAIAQTLIQYLNG